MHFKALKLKFSEMFNLKEYIIFKPLHLGPSRSEMGLLAKEAVPETLLVEQKLLVTTTFSPHMSGAASGNIYLPGLSYDLLPACGHQSSLYLPLLRLQKALQQLRDAEDAPGKGVAWFIEEAFAGAKEAVRPVTAPAAHEDKKSRRRDHRTEDFPPSTNTNGLSRLQFQSLVMAIQGPAAHLLPAADVNQYYRHLFDGLRGSCKSSKDSLTKKQVQDFLSNVADGDWGLALGDRFKSKKRSKNKMKKQKVGSEQQKAKAKPNSKSKKKTASTKMKSKNQQQKSNAKSNSQKQIAKS